MMLKAVSRNRADGGIETVIAKCHCRNCNAHIEFEAADAGAMVECPNCKMETQLFVPPPAFKPKIPPAPVSAAAAPSGGMKLQSYREHLEDRLDRIGSNYFSISCVAAVLVVCDAFLAITQEAGMRAFLDIVGAMALAGHGYVVQSIFRFLAEHLRLTRQGLNR